MKKIIWITFDPGSYHEPLKSGVIKVCAILWKGVHGLYLSILLWAKLCPHQTSDAEAPAFNMTVFGEDF